MVRAELIEGDCLNMLDNLGGILPQIDCIFADPPDNIGLNYAQYDDNLPPEQYALRFTDWLNCFADLAPVVWLSVNARWTFALGAQVHRFLARRPQWDARAFVQTFTFGQNRRTDCGNGHRPLWRLMHNSARLYPDAIKVESWRQRNGDPRAAEGGCVPLDHWDIPRVTGNSAQRRRHHPTQLHEGLVQRAIELTTLPGDHVLDPFAGTGTTLRVCRRIARDCTLIEIDPGYCEKIREEHSDLLAKPLPNGSLDWPL